MSAVEGIREKAFVIRVAQRLAGPAEAIAGFQEIIVEELRAAGPAEALEDALKVQEAARMLLLQVSALTGGGSPPDRARLRHDLRTPVNAVLGYSELILEEHAGTLPAAVLADIRTVIGECALLVGQIDRVTGDAAEIETAAIDALAAVSLERTLTRSRRRREELAGHVLVIDDTQQTRELLRRQLMRQGHEVTAAASAAEALEILERGGIELALVDILMPDMNGIELLTRLRAQDRWQQLPVIMVSGLTDLRAVTRCIEAGAEDYLEKPVDAVLLRSRVQAALQKARWQQKEHDYIAQVEYERDRADALLHAMLPAPVIRRLRAGEEVIADRFDAATIVFADIVDFTPLTRRIPAEELVGRLAELFLAFDGIAERHGIEKIKTIGDAYMAACGVPEPAEDHAARAFDFARDLIAATRDGSGGLDIRVGLHAGPVVAGLIGRVRFLYDVWGETVNLASRLESTGVPGHIHLTGEAAAHLRADQRRGWEARGAELKGIGWTETFLAR
ncbi:adenylate/guanylate cyclase domain-containing protein [Mangrovicoccus sp. HB161399]|uniref:adenylate/guanylate cyclase domain-containing protein n=1 Tax=Mangrovicoccus sp. HB161399 TaxID=2720392 RepID=UPI00155320BD|nr:adenylate/guanylate cyclase domain-containing protein [Mangrovicoccus sp. HB161399]